MTEMIPTQKKIRDAAGRLTEMLSQYEAVLALDPDKSECMVRREGITLWFHKNEDVKGKPWMLEVNVESEPDGIWRGIREISLSNRVIVARMILDIPEAMEEARKEALEDMEEACDIVTNVLADTRTRARQPRMQ